MQLITVMETWEAILGQLKNDPDAQTNCANASPFFWELLKKERVLFLFPKVVEVIAPKANKRIFAMYLEGSTKDGCDYYKEKEEYFWPKKDRKDWRLSILECRLVCSVWNKAVEHCYESFILARAPELLPEICMDPRSPVQRIAKSWTKDLFEFREFWTVNQFMSFNFEINGPPKNPFFGRSVIIDVPREENFLEGLTYLLGLFGKEVWYCVLLWFEQLTGKEFVSELCAWLVLMPNLKVLFMVCPQNLDALSKKDFQVSRIPKLEKLESLDFSGNGLILSALLRVNFHVKVLRMSKIENGAVDLKVGRLLRNLNEFSPIGCKSGLKMFDQFGHEWKQPSRLYLEDGFKYFVKLESNWASTLVELEMVNPFGMNKAKILRDSKNLRLKLVNIRRLSLAIDGLFYLDFIEPMQGSLEHLEFVGIEFRNGCTVKERERVKKEQRFELVGFEEKMHMSNVWKVFGKLETIKIFHFSWEGEFMIFSKEGKKYLCEEMKNEDDEEDDQSDSD